MTIMNSERRVNELTNDIEVLKNRMKVADAIFGTTIGILLFIAVMVCPLMVL